MTAPIFQAPWQIAIFFAFMYMLFGVVNPMKKLKYKTQWNKGLGKKIRPLVIDQKSSNPEWIVYYKDDSGKKQQKEVTEEKYWDHWWTVRLEYVRIMPPKFLFGLVWFVLFVFIAASGFLFFKEEGNNPGDSLDACVLAFGFLVVMLKTWSFVFFEGRWLVVGLLMIVASEVCVLVLLSYMGILKTVWISFGLLVPLALWLVYAFCLNLAFLWADHAIKNWETDGQSQESRRFV